MPTMTTRALPSHIEFDEQGRPWIEGTGRKVVEIAIDRRAGLSAEQIHEAHPDLPLAKIHAALAYYFDHQPELDGEIAQIVKYVEEVKKQHPNKITREMLEARLKSHGDQT
jgi:uncharacterized protein (DUF433 family)